MSANWKIFFIESKEGEQLYEFPDQLQSVNRVLVGARSLNFGTTRIDGKKYIVLLEPVQVSGIKMEVMGR